MNANSSDWYVLVDGSSPSAPMSAAQVRDAVAMGRVPHSARVCKVGSTQWVPITSVAELAPQRASASPPSPYGAPAPSPYGAAPASPYGGPPSGGPGVQGVMGGGGDTWYVAAMPGAPPQGPMNDQQIVQAIAQGVVT